MLLMYNAIALLLMRSPIKQVQAMTLHRVYELLLGRTMLACLEAQRTTLWIDPVPTTSERPLQEELVRLFNTQTALPTRTPRPAEAARSTRRKTPVTSFELRIRFPA